jgi:hypothetical protein
MNDIPVLHREIAGMDRQIEPSSTIVLFGCDTLNGID